MKQDMSFTIFLITTFLFCQNSSYVLASAQEIIDVTTHEKRTPLSRRMAEPTETRQDKMRFKLGFEFQENQGLCRWGIESTRFQKKPLFTIKDKQTNRRLWHLEIDTVDIEFVTQPFTDQEGVLLDSSIRSILQALNTLKQHLSQREEITFGDWADSLETHFGTTNPVNLWYFGIFIDFRDKILKRPTAQWEPLFSPQVTIQHPLKYTIPLYFGLFGFDENPSYMIPFVAALPYIDVLTKALKDGDSTTYWQGMQGYTKPINGLVFLHALNLVQMSPLDERSDKECLEETLTCLRSYYQVDPKMMLALMSRRPFSAIYRDLHLPSRLNYEEYFSNVMARNEEFSRYHKVPRLFAHTNYGEQYFDPGTGVIKQLSHFLPLFNQSFLANHQINIATLLNHGVITTAMIRNFKEDIKTDDLISAATLNQQYFTHSLKSVATPSKRYTVKLDNPGIQSQPTNHDSLSPPWFLDLDNSMGRMKDDMTQEDKPFGEAIIEVRGIKYAGLWFLKKASLSGEVRGKFLAKPDETLVMQTGALFKFLNNFGSMADFNDISLGMTYIIVKR